MRLSILIVSMLILSGCGTLMGSVGSSSTSLSSSASLSGDRSERGLIAYRLVHARGVAGSSQADPRRQPRNIQAHQAYPFRNEIPFMPRGAGERVSSGFGWRNLWGRADFHCGVDVVADAGTPVYAVVGGQVTLSRSAGPRGGLVIYSGGRQYTYWHVTPRRGLDSGDRVRRGQQIGTLADWGGNTHLHYGLYLTGDNSSPNARETTNCVDPMELARHRLF